MHTIYLLMILCSPYIFSQTGVPGNCLQVIVVTTDSVKASSGILTCFERKNSGSEWKQISGIIPIVFGRNGLGWGRGLNPVDTTGLPLKYEGDGRSPAGIFELGPAFGYAKEEEMKNLKIPYIHISEMTECIDDTASEYYNTLVDKDRIPEPDWNSSEKMFYTGIWYEQGVVVMQNSDPVAKGRGSCIFLHNWSTPDETSSGCTEMEPANLTKIIYWLNEDSHPLLVQLTKDLHNKYRKQWQLP